MNNIKLGIVVQQQGKKWHFIADKNKVEIGTRAGMDIVIPEFQSNIPEKHLLFRFNESAQSYELCIIPGLFKGWVRIKNKPYHFEDLIKQVKVRREGPVVIIPLEVTYRGRVEIGKTVIGFGFQKVSAQYQRPAPGLPKKAVVGWIEVIQGGKIRKFMVSQGDSFSVGNTTNETLILDSYLQKLNLFEGLRNGYVLTVVPGFTGILMTDKVQKKIDQSTFKGRSKVKFLLRKGDRAELKFGSDLIIRLGVREEGQAVAVEKKIEAEPEPAPKPLIFNWQRFNSRPHDGMTVGEHSKDKTVHMLFNVMTVLLWFFWILYTLTMKAQAQGITLSTAEETLRRLQESEIIDVNVSEDIEALRRGTLGLGQGQSDQGSGDGSGDGGSGGGSGGGTGSGAGGGVGTGNTDRVSRGLRVLGVGSSGPSTVGLGLGGGDASVQDLLAGGAALSGVSGGAASAAGGTGGLGGGVTGTVGVTGGGEISTGPAVGGDLQHQRTAGVSGGSLAGVSGEAAVSGARDPGDVRRTIVRYQGRLKYYYEKELEVNPNIQGKIVVRLTIAESGGVSGVTMVSSTLGSPRLEQQLLAAIGTWQFPAIEPGGGSFTFTVPFNFYSQ